MRKRKIKKAARAILNSKPNRNWFSFFKLNSSPNWIRNCYHRCKKHQYYLFQKDKSDVGNIVLVGDDDNNIMEKCHKAFKTKIRYSDFWS